MTSNPSTAAVVTSDRFRRTQRETPDEELIQYAKGTIRCGNDATDDEDNWDKAMQSMGIDDDLRDRILDPTSRDIRLTQTATYWVLETVSDLYDFLLYFNPRIDNPEMLFSQPVGLASRIHT